MIPNTLILAASKLIIIYNNNVSFEYHTDHIVVKNNKPTYSQYNDEFVGYSDEIYTNKELVDLYVDNQTKDILRGNNHTWVPVVSDLPF